MSKHHQEPERRQGVERRSGADRRNRSGISRKHSAPTVAGVAGTLATYVAALVSQKYGVPLEVTAPVAGLVFATLAGLYNKIVLPWME